MENASKALIMAGSVLIALMIIGALLLMFNNLSNYQQIGKQEKKEAQIIEFNNQYETYNRNNVRGSELYSLLNRTADYNRRKSIEGTGSADEGQYLAFEPIKITFDLNGKLGQFRAPTTSSGDTYTYLIINNKYEQSSTKNEFENDISSTLTTLENRYGKQNLTNLVTGVSKIFIKTLNSTQEQREIATNNFKSAYKSSTVDGININDIEWNNIKEGTNIRKAVYQYYEYIQFKRAKFDCESVKYNSETGRIIEMNFKFNGKFQ